MISHPTLALQLHSLRREAAIDAEGTVRQVSSLGFDGVEIVRDYGWTAAQWQRVLAETGLTVVAAHVPLETLEDDLAAVLTFYRALGTRRLVVTALPRAPQTAYRYHDGARRLNVVGRRLAEAGFILAYHNHDFEFQWIEDALAARTGLEVLLDETDPACVGFEFDAYWLEFAGRNAVDFIERYAERLRLVHAKDLRKRDRREVPVGQGDVDFRALLPLCAARDCPVVLEYEGPDAIAGAREGAAFLRAISGGWRADSPFQSA